jgi:pSer/pThr/pTyr-binding forkhead associated (FHA) protein
MDLQLVVVRGRSATRTVRLTNGVTTVGRQEGCQLRISSSQVSRKHCQLFEQKGLLYVKDLGSSNGTYVNGQKVVEARALVPGDELTIGSVKFRVERHGEVQPGKLSDTAVARPVSAAEPLTVEPTDVFEVGDDDEPLTQTTARPQAPVPAEPAAAAAPAPAQELGEDAVADFLLDIDVDDE